MNLLIEKLNELKVDLKFISIPYLAKGTTLTGTDCSGLSCLFLQENGIELPLGVGQQSIKEFIRTGKIITDKNELQPLDILIFKYGDVYHCGVYIGYGKFLQQNKVTKSSIARLSSMWGSYFIYAVRPTDLIYNNEKEYNEIKDKNIEFIASAIAAWAAASIFGVTALGAGVGGAFAVGLAYGLVYTAVYVGVLCAISYGISALANSINQPARPSFGAGGAAEGSNRYSFGPISSVSSSDLPVGVLYGELKLAGNAVYQSEPGELTYRCDTLCEGEINSITDIRINDVPVADLDGCSVTAYLGTAAQTVDSRFSNRLSGLRNTANLALTLKTGDKLRGGFPTVTCVAQGLLVETWDGLKWTTTKTYSNNPVACIRDFIINTRYGVGLPKSLLDNASFGEAYDYCNVLVSDGAGGTETRFTLNYIIDTKKAAIDTLNDMLSVCASFIVWSGNRLKLRIEKVENVVQNFTMSNIVEKSFSYHYVPKDTMVNRVKLLYIDPTQNYTKVYALAEDQINQDARSNIEGGNGIIEKEIPLLGVTKFSRASRLANMFLKLVKATPITCKFTVGIYALHCEPGDVITVSHDVPAWVNKPFRIFSIEEEANDEATIICKEYNDSVYDDSYGSGLTVYQYGTPPNYLKNTSDITSITLDEVGWRNEDGTHIASLDVTWIAPTVTEYLTGYYLEWSKDGEGYVYATRADIGSTSVRIPNAEVGSVYTVKIKTVNYYGIYSNGSSSDTHLITGKDANPPDVTNFLGNQFRDALVFSWDKITSVPDISHYEIKEGTTWAAGTPIGVLLKNNTWTYNNIRNGTVTYWIKAVDNSGNYSVTANSTQIIITTIPFQNVLISRDEHTAWTGVYNNVYKSGDSLFISPGYASGDFIADWLDVGQVVTAKLGYEHIVSISGDLAWDTDASYAFDTFNNLRWGGFDASQNASFFIQTSGDSGPSGDWQAWQYADYYFRHVRTKIVLQRDDITQATSLDTLTQKIDVPDIDEWGPTDGSYRFCPTTGDSITFDKTFYYPPEVSIMVFPSGSVIRTPQVTASKTGFAITLYDLIGDPIQGNYRFHIHGF